MSPLAYDPKSTVAGPAATLTVAGLAGGLVAGWVAPLYALVAGAAGAVLAIAFWFVPAAWARPVARLGLGLVVGATLAWALTSLGILPQGFQGPR